MNEETKKRMEEAAPKYDGSKCSSTRREGWLNGYTAAYNDAQGEIEKLKAENSEMRFELEAKQRPLSEQVLELTLENQKLKADHVFMENQWKISTKILAKAREENAELVENLSAVRMDWNKYCDFSGDSAMGKIGMVLDAHNARQKERG